MLVLPLVEEISMHLNDKTSDLEKALILYNQGNLKEAELLYRNILKLDPNHAEANNMLGIIAHATGNLDAAIKLFLKQYLMIQNKLDILAISEIRLLS